MEALTNVGDVTVTGTGVDDPLSPPATNDDPWVIQFNEDRHVEVTLDDSLLTGGTSAIAFNSTEPARQQYLFDPDGDCVLPPTGDGSGCPFFIDQLGLNPPNLVDYEFDATGGHNHWHVPDVVRYSLWNEAQTTQVATADPLALCCGTPVWCPEPRPPATTDRVLRRVAPTIRLRPMS